MKIRVAAARSKASLSQQLARWLLGLRADDVSPSRLHRMRIALLDFLGCVHGASGLRETDTVLPLVRPGLFQVPGQAQSMDLASACIAWGMTGALLQWHDGYGRGGNHPSSSVLPGLLAQSQNWGSLLMPALVGYEIANRLAALTHPAQSLNGSAPTSSMGAMGAAAALARWHVLDERTAAAALGLAGFAAPIAAFEGLRARGSAVPLHSGLASRAGLEAVQLARAGLDASATLLEGNAGPGLLTFLGAPAGALADINPADWRGETLDQVYLKPFPGCRHVHPAVEAALGLRARLADNTLACRRIEVSTYDLAVSFGAMPRPQAELYDCLMSLPWCVASALLSGAPDAQTVSTGRDSPELWSLSKRVVVRHDASHQQHYPGRLGATLVVVDDRGVRHEQQAVLYYADSAQTYSPAGPFGPVLDEAGVIAKFLRLTCATLTPSRQQALIEGILEAQPSHECRATTGASTR